MIPRALQIVVILSVTGCFFPVSAHAYLDAGTGSMLLQVIVAGSAAALLLLKTYWRRVKAWVTRAPEQPEASQVGDRQGDDGGP